MGERRSLICYYIGYVRGLQELGTRESMTRKCDTQRALIKTAEEGSEMGYTAIGTLDGLHQSMKLTIKDNKND